MNEREKELLTAARELLMGEHIEDACTHYYAAHEENSKNAEAEFFGDYLAYSSLIKERNGAAAARALDAMTKNIEKAVASIKEAEFQEDTSETDISGAEQQELCRLILISKMVKIYTPITRFLFTGRLSTTRDTIEGGVLGLYALGNAIEKEFEAKPAFVKEALVAWKEAVALQTQFYAYKYYYIYNS